MGKSMKKLVVGLLLVGVVGLAVSKLTGGEATTDEETEGIDRVSTQDDDAADVEESKDDSEDPELEVEVESADEGFEADLDLPAASGGLDTFDYLSVLAAGAKAAYEEYRNRV